MRSFFVGIIVFFLSSGLATAGYAEPRADAYPFAKGRTRLTLLFGRGEAFDNTYSIYGLGVGYYVQNGLEAGLSVEEWTGHDPGIFRISPEVRYVFYDHDVFKPYLGAFFRHSFVEQHRDVNAVGLRGGVNIMAGSRTYFAAGLVSRKTFNCDDAADSRCTDTYPEFLIAVVF